ncbi:multidrug DMT transporter permease [Streptomyces sp. NPDC055013]
MGRPVLSGVGSAAAMHFLDRGLSRGAMNTVVPVSAVTSVVLSVLCGCCCSATGQQHPHGPASSSPCPRSGSSGTTAGAGGKAAARGRAQKRPAECRPALRCTTPRARRAGEPPARHKGRRPCDRRTARQCRVAAVLVLLPVDSGSAASCCCRAGSSARRRWSGAGAALGLVLYLLAAQRQLPAIAVVPASLYPALSGVLGFALLREPLTARRVIGLAGAAVATVLLTLG